MNDKLGLGWQDLQRLFSVILCVDRSWSVVYASPTLQRYVEGLENKPKLVDVFDIKRPYNIASWEAALSHIDSLFLMVAKNRRFAIRGQMLHTHSDGTEVLCFCGAPWLFWINSVCPDVQLRLEDFTAQDVQLDQLFFMSTEKQMVADLEEVNEELRQAREQAVAATEDKARFFSKMSHEMRTPLNGMFNVFTLLERQELPQAAEELVHLGSSAANNLIRIANYVLDVSKSYADQELEIQRFKLTELMQTTANIVRPSALKKSLSLKLQVDPRLFGEYQAEARILNQILVNLLGNAVKFTETGGIELRASLASHIGDSNVVRFEVADTGIGIAEEDRENIFERYWSGHHPGRESHEQGTGLGLDIVRQHVATMGGNLDFQSSPGEGTTFWFELPLTRTADTESNAGPDAASADPEPAAQFKGRVLLVDDNETNLLLGSMVLETFGVEVCKAAGGAEAVAAAQDQHFDLIFMDLNMPEIDGLEATRLIRAHTTDRPALPIVALTAYADDWERGQCIKAGMNGHLTKPIIRDLLQQELARWMAPCDAGDSDLQEATPTSATDHVDPEALVNRSVLDDLHVQLGADRFNKVIEKFLSETVTRWTELESACNSQDTTTMTRQVHSMASTFRSLGLIEAGDAMGGIEECLRSGTEPPSEWLQQLAKLKTESLEQLEKVVSR